jgi:16S rRNA (uracil1498-N3)-methyltransferase
LPVLHPLSPFEKVLSVKSEKRLIAHCEDGVKLGLNEAVNAKNGSVLILIGPEGDFTPDEITLAQEKGFHAIDLGSNRLRTETAGVYCAAVLNGRK